MRCIVVYREPNCVWAKQVDLLYEKEEFILIDTSYSLENLHNYSFRDIPLGTYFTYYRGKINGFPKNN